MSVPIDICIEMYDIVSMKINKAEATKQMKRDFPGKEIGILIDGNCYYLVFVADSKPTDLMDGRTNWGYCNNLESWKRWTDGKAIKYNRLTGVKREINLYE